MAGIWAPLAATATRNLPMQQAGAGAGVYNATRQVGAVLGSAAIAVLMDSRLAAEGLTAGGPARRPARAAARAAARPVQRRHGAVVLLPAGVLVLGWSRCSSSCCRSTSRARPRARSAPARRGLAPTRASASRNALLLLT